MGRKLQTIPVQELSDRVGQVDIISKDGINYGNCWKAVCSDIWWLVGTKPDDVTKEHVRWYCNGLAFYDPRKNVIVESRQEFRRKSRFPQDYWEVYNAYHGSK